VEERQRVMHRRQGDMPPLDHPGHQGQGMKEEANPGHEERGFRDALPPSSQLDQKQSGAEKIEEQRDLEKENVHGPTSPLNFGEIIIETAREGGQANSQPPSPRTCSTADTGPCTPAADRCP